MRLKGILVEWNHDRGFGFVEPASGGARAFCHISEFKVRSRRPTVGDRITYETSRDKRGRLRALKIQPANAPRAKEVRKPSRMSPWVAVLVSALFLSAVTGLVVMRHLPWFVPVVYLVASGITVLAYALDKSAAMNGRWRTEEATLHLLALAGGWPGAWISQLMFRHKTRKASFIVGFVASVLLNLAALAWVVIKL
jgi:uncharacterized membrane protein YsdA (DUF1294 family)/cold shock CspA family protein